MRGADEPVFCLNDAKSSFPIFLVHTKYGHTVIGDLSCMDSSLYHRLYKILPRWPDNLTGPFILFKCNCTFGRYAAREFYVKTGGVIYE